MLLSEIFPFLPLSWFIVFAFGMGVIIGSFLNVYIYRFHTGKSLAGHSHCLSCGTTLKWFELFPLFSFLALRGKCRTCGCKITSRYFFVELCTGILFSLVLTITQNIILIPLLWLVVSVLVVITVYDYYHFIIPDSLTAVMTILSLLILTQEFFVGRSSVEEIFWTVVSALGGVTFFLLLWLVSKGAWLGFGDVKLAFPLGLLVGPEFVFSFVVLSFWVGAAISLTLLGVAKLKRGKTHLHLIDQNLTMKSAVPFAPFLVASCLIILFTHFNVLELFTFI
jgi:leader peptidase (prepilin peptidase)/N-methyltransferase